MKRVFLLAILAAVCALRATAQERPDFVATSDTVLRVSNATYRLRELPNPRGAMLLVDGFENAAVKGFRLPTRTLLVEIPAGATPTVTLQGATLAPTRAAHPFVIATHGRSKDTLITTTYVSVFDERGAIPQPAPSVENVRTERRNGRLYLRFDLPLLFWNEAARTSAFLTEATIRIALRGAALARSAPTTPQFVHTDLRYADTSGAWLHAGDPYYRFSLRADTLVRLTKAWFQQNTGTVPPPAKVRMYTKGGEVPLFASGMEDGSIDDGDYFLFHAHRNYAAGDYRRVPHGDEEYPQFLDRYADSTVYWLTWGVQDGARATRAPMPAAQPVDTLAWYCDLLHHEVDFYLISLSTNVNRAQDPRWTSEDTWFERAVKPSTTVPYAFTIPRLYPGVDGRSWFKTGSWYAADTAAQVVGITVNQSPLLDSGSVHRDEQALLRGVVPHAFLQEGDNTFTIVGIGGNPDDLAIIDWFDVEYPTPMTARDNGLSFPVRDSLMLGYRLLRADGFTDSTATVLRVRGDEMTQLARRWVATGAGFAALCADTVQFGDRYIFATPSTPAAAPAATQRAPFALRRPASRADYIIITDESMLASAQTYADFIRTQYGVATLITTAGAVYDEFSFGFFCPEAIREFVYTMQTAWPDPKPGYLLLLGDANYDYKVLAGTMHAPKYPQNFVPSFGFPVADTWYVLLDSLLHTPAMKIGRIPARSNEDVLFYLAKHRNYLTTPYDDWHKNYIFFSGGLPDIDGQSGLDQLHMTNRFILDQYVTPAPVGGNAHDFYKTITPQSDFGPVTPEEFKNAIDNGGQFISYLGHSATQTWDNSIIYSTQLNNARNRNFLVSDFGCATGRFAEPDITSFCEDFVLSRDASDPSKNSQAIVYLGNSSLGYASVATTLPILFYQNILRNGITEISDAHEQAKEQLLRDFGPSFPNQLAMLTNTLIGDPILKITIPQKPNFVIKSEWPRLEKSYVTDRDDSVGVVIPFANFGKVTGDSCVVLVEDYRGTTLFTSVAITRPCPLYMDTIRVAVPTKKTAGVRQLRITLDPKNAVDELYKNDNYAVYDYSIGSANLLTLNTPTEYAGTKPDSITVLNPMYPTVTPSAVRFDFDRDTSFKQAQTANAPYGKVFSRLTAVPSLGGARETFWRVSTGAADVSGPFHFLNAPATASWLQNDSLSFGGSVMQYVAYRGSGVQLGSGVIDIQLASAGHDDGNFSVVQKNGVNVLPTSFNYQYSVAVFDSVTLDVKRIRQYATWGNQSDADSLKAFLHAIQTGELAAIASGDEPSNRKATFADELKSLGSALVDSLQNRDSWAMLGHRGAATGSVPEQRTPHGMGRAIVDTGISVQYRSGSMRSNLIGPAAKWIALAVTSQQPAGSALTLSVFGVTASNAVDTLRAAQPAQASVDLSQIDARKYPYLRVATDFAIGTGGASPRFASWSVRYMDLPELAANYQSIYTQSDTVLRYGSFPLHVGVVNPGPSSAGNFSVNVETVDANNNRAHAATLSVSGLTPDGWYNTDLIVPGIPTAGPAKIVVTIDPADSVREQYENNNTYIATVFAKQDTTKPAIAYTFDGLVPMDGDYVSTHPEIVVHLFDKTPYPVTDVRNFTLYLDDTLITKDPTPRVVFHQGTGLEKASITFSPALTDGEHYFRFNAKNGLNVSVDSMDISLRVRVASETKVTDFYNYPNPFAEQTAFLFNLAGSGLPDEMTIKVYTVAGRKIREIKLAPTQLRIGFNTVQWDGRDQDGDRIANGVYFYRVTTTASGKSDTFIGKIAVLR